jgi:ElaB/YqjD/DUF883 family membrane-anchored ribosome-binding protein
MKYIKYSLATICAAIIFTLVACEKGPAEKAGEKIDNAAEKAAESMDKATDKMKDTAEDAADKTEDAMDKMNN